MKEHTKYARLKADCEDALARGLPEKCLQLLKENLDEREVHLRERWIALSGQFHELKWQQLEGAISSNEYTLGRNRIRQGLLALLEEIKPEQISLLRRTHDRILVYTYTGSILEWEKLFPEAFFSYAAVIRYNDLIPEDFQTPDVVIFDDTEENPVDVRPQMIRCLKAMPKAHFLYVGDKNPFKDSETLEGKAVWRRCSNANTQFTVHARLHELLEFRKIYGTLQNL